MVGVKYLARKKKRWIFFFCVCVYKRFCTHIIKFGVFFTFVREHIITRACTREIKEDRAFFGFRVHTILLAFHEYTFGSNTFFLSFHTLLYFAKHSQPWTKLLGRLALVFLEKERRHQHPLGPTASERRRQRQRAPPLLRL